MCWPHQSTNTFCPVGAFVKEGLCAVLHFCSNLVEILILVLDHYDTSLESFPQVFFPQASTNTLLQKARSCLFLLLCATQIKQRRCCGFLICHLAQWTRSQVLCTSWKRGFHGDHVFGVLCNVFVLYSVRPRPFPCDWPCPA